MLLTKFFLVITDEPNAFPGKFIGIKRSKREFSGGKIKDATPSSLFVLYGVASKKILLPQFVGVIAAGDLLKTP